MTWPRYLVWDKYQADFVKRAVGENANVTVVGTIWFQSGANELPSLEKTGIGVFDVTPHRVSRYVTLGNDNEFYTPKVANTFLNDISEEIRKLELLMLWKRKRKIGNLAHPHYRHLTDKLSKCNHVIMIEPDTSVIRMIESCNAIISMPFTSTALIAREMGKPSIYYDPSGLLQRDDRAAHGIHIIVGVDELQK